MSRHDLLMSCRNLLRELFTHVPLLLGQSSSDQNQQQIRFLFEMDPLWFLSVCAIQSKNRIKADMRQNLKPSDRRTEDLVRSLLPGSVMYLVYNSLAKQSANFMCQYVQSMDERVVDSQGWKDGKSGAGSHFDGSAGESTDAFVIFIFVIVFRI